MGADIGMMDDEEAFCVGDRPIDNINPADLIGLGAIIDSIQQETDEGTDARNMDNLVLLTRLYGEDLVVL